MKIFPLIGAENEHKGRAGAHESAHLPERVDGVGVAVAHELNGVDGKKRIAVNGFFKKRQTFFDGGGDGFLPGAGREHEVYARQRHDARCLAGNAQVAVVHRIKGAAEKTDSASDDDQDDLSLKAACICACLKKFCWLADVCGTRILSA